MTKQEKQLLLQDLCARLPHGVFVKDRNGIHQLTIGNTELADLFYGKCNIKPFLRPLSSMTEEEKETLWNALDKDMDITLDGIDAPIIHVYKNRCYRCHPTFNEIEFLNQHCFDWRGLIPLGLALQAPEGMYDSFQS